MSKFAFELVDEARNNAQAALPEIRIGGIEPERRQKLFMAQRAASLQHVEIFALEAGVAVLENVIKGIDQAIAEGYLDVASDDLKTLTGKSGQSVTDFLTENRAVLLRAPQ